MSLFTPGRFSLLRTLGLFVLLGLAGREARGYEIAGTIKDRAGVPILEATVWLCRDHEVVQTRTGADGAFHFSEALPGPTSIVGQKTAFSLTGADLHVLGDTQVPLIMVESATAMLRVVDETFAPVPGSIVKTLYIADTFTVPVADLSEHGFPALRANDTGFIAVPGLPKGSHFGFVIYRPKYAETQVPYMPVQDKQQVFQLFPGCAVRGRVLSPEGKGVARARVAVYAEGASGLREYTERLSDNEGYYVAYVAPGDYQVVARHPEFASQAPVPVSLAPGDEEGVADHTLLPPRHIAGTVQAPDGTPAPGVLVRYLVEGHTYGDQLTRHDGAFDMIIPPGEGALRVLPSLGFTTEHFGDIKVTLDTGLRADLAPVKLRALPAVEGTIVAADGTPQPKVLIASKDLDPPLWAISDDKGHFKLQLSYMPESGRASFRAEKDLRFQRKDFDVDLKAPGPVSLMLEEFEPDVSHAPPLPGQNDLTTLLDADAPEIATDAWFNGDEVKLAALRGKVVVLTFWGGFDDQGAGRDRMEELRALHALLEGVDDVVFLGVHDNGSDEEEIRQYISDYRIPFPVGRDTEEFTTFRRYLVNVIPQTVLIDKHSRVRFFQVDGRLLELIKSLRREAD